MNNTPNSAKEPWSKHKTFALMVLPIMLPLLLVWVLYLEEDYRGAKYLAAMQAKWEAKGVSFDLDSYIPPTIPDDENLAAIPLFKPQYDSSFKCLNATVFNQGLSSISGIGDPTRKINDSFKSKVVFVNTSVDNLYRYKTKPASPDKLDSLNSIYPAWADIVNAAQSRQHCRFNVDYAAEKVGGIYSVTIVHGQSVLGAYAISHAILELDKGRTALAFADLKILMIVLGGVCKDSYGMEFVSSPLVFDSRLLLTAGFQIHKWSDSQLAEHQHQITDINYLEQIHNFWLASICDSRLWDKSVKANRSTSTIPSFLPPFYGYRYWPDGWIDINEAQIHDYQIKLANSFVSSEHLVDPAATNDLARQIKIYGTGLTAPSNVIFVEYAKYSVSRAKELAYTQANLDEAYIACGLERYYLVHHTYPAKLEQLMPDFANAIPHDVMGGKPYVYKLNADGTFILYSIGWNEVDDGGTPSPRTDPSTGDWVWPGHG